MFEKACWRKADMVTGGGSGLGAAMGRRFVELGAELIICGRRLELLEATAAQMRSDLGGSGLTRYVAVPIIPATMRSSA